MDREAETGLRHLPAHRPPGRGSEHAAPGAGAEQIQGLGPRLQEGQGKAEAHHVLLGSTRTTDTQVTWGVCGECRFSPPTHRVRVSGVSASPAFTVLGLWTSKRTAGQGVLTAHPLWRRTAAEFSTALPARWQGRWQGRWALAHSGYRASLPILFLLQAPTGSPTWCHPR